jgi:hypothetical protein
MILPRSWISSLQRMESLSIIVPIWFCINEILTTTSIVSMLLEPMSKPTMSLIYPILMPLAPWIAFIFNTMTTSMEAMIYCICKAMNRMITCHCITPIPITPGSDYQDGTLHCQERWHAKRFEDNQLHRTSPLTPLRPPVPLQLPCATSVPRSKTLTMKKPFN